MSDTSKRLRNIITVTKDGEWGTGESLPDHTEMLVIRGTDFESVRLGDYSGVPRRFILNRISERKRLRAGDILIETAGGSTDRPTGRTLLLKKRLFDESPAPVTCASFSRFIRINPEVADPEYVFWYLQYLYNIGEMEMFQIQHTGVARFQYTVFADSVSIPLPPLPEQRAIAHILGTLDDKIELNRRMNRTLEELARALFHCWFVAFDPVRAKAAGRQPAGMDAATAALFPDSFEETEHGEIPAGWTIEPLSALFNITKGGVWGNDELSDDASIPAIALRGIDCHRLAVREDIDVAPRFFTARQLSGREVAEGSILVEGSGSNCGRSLLWLDRYTNLFQHPVTYSNFVKRLDPISCDGISLVAWQQMRRAYEEGELAGYRTGTAFPNFDVRGLLAGFQVVVPPKPIAERYFETYCSLMGTDLLIQNRTLTTLRDSLLPKLLSGEIRVADAGEQVEKAAVGIALCLDLLLL